MGFIPLTLSVAILVLLSCCAPPPRVMADDSHPKCKNGESCFSAHPMAVSTKLCGSAETRLKIPLRGTIDLQDQSRLIADIHVEEEFLITGAEAILHNLHHTYIGDLEIQLHFEAYSFVLNPARGPNPQLHLKGDYSFRDDADGNIRGGSTDGTTIQSGAYKLWEGSFGSLNGATGNGTWTFSLKDIVAQDTGKVDGFTLVLYDERQQPHYYNLHHDVLIYSPPKTANGEGCGTLFQVGADNARGEEIATFPVVVTDPLNHVFFEPSLDLGDCSFQYQIILTDASEEESRDSTPAPVTVMIRCGDGSLDGECGEVCDDRNRNDGDGCSRTCQIEDGWECSIGSTTTRCHTKCGDGLVKGDEECDDGNAEPSDGCTNMCVVEKGWRCVGSPSVCEVIPVPEIHAVTPDRVPTRGYDIQIDGVHLGQEGDIIAVTVGSSVCEDVIPNSDSSIQCQVPAGTGGPLAVTVTVNGLQSKDQRHIWYQAPEITSLSRVDRQGGTLTVLGENFGDNASNVVVSVGSDDCDDVELVVPHQQVTCNVGPGIGLEVSVRVSVSEQQATGTMGRDGLVIEAVLASDPDDRDAKFGNGDRITITFSEPTNTPSVAIGFDGLVGQSNGAVIHPHVYTAAWEDNGQSLLIDFVDSNEEDELVIGETAFEITAEIGFTNADGDVYATVGSSSTLTGDWGDGSREWDTGFTVTAGSLLTSEDGDVAAFTVVLYRQPSLPVSLPIVVPGNEAVPSVDRLHFDSRTWNVQQSVMLMGVDDHVFQGDHNYTIQLGPALSHDFSFAGYLATLEGRSKDNDHAGFEMNLVEWWRDGNSLRVEYSFLSDPVAEVTCDFSYYELTRPVMHTSTHIHRHLVSQLKVYPNNAEATRFADTPQLEPDPNLPFTPFALEVSLSSDDPLYNNITRYVVVMLATPTYISSHQIYAAAGSGGIFAFDAPSFLLFSERPEQEMNLELNHREKVAVKATPSNWTDIHYIGRLSEKDLQTEVVSDNGFRSVIVNGLSRSIYISQPSVPTVDELGSTTTLSVTLPTPPSGSVVVELIPTSTMDVEILPSQVNFTSDVPKEVTVIGRRNDIALSSERTVNITARVVDEVSDRLWSNATSNTVSVTVTDIHFPLLLAIDPPLITLTSKEAVSIFAVDIVRGLTLIVGNTTVESYNITEADQYDARSRPRLLSELSEREHEDLSDGTWNTTVEQVNLESRDVYTNQTYGRQVMELRFMIPGQPSIGYRSITIINQDGGSITVPEGVMYVKSCAEEGVFGTSFESCQPCPEGGYCPGGNRIIPLIGYSSPGEESGFVKRCKEPAELKCLGNFECAVGYNGTYCSECVAGYHNVRGICEPCPEDNGAAYATAATALAFFGSIVVTGLTLSDAAYDKYCTSLANFQILAAMGSMAVATMPSFLLAMYDQLSMLLFDLNFVKVSCLRKEPVPFLTVYWGTFMFFLLLALLATLLFKIRMFLTKDPIKRLWVQDRFKHVFVIHGALIYINITSLCLDCVLCQDFGGVLTMAKDQVTPCYQGLHLPSAILAWILLVIGGSAGIAWGCYLVLVIKRTPCQISAGRYESRFGFLYAPFEPQKCTFGIPSVFIIPWVMGLVVGLTSDDSKRDMQFIVTMALLCLHLIALLILRPHADSIEVWMAVFSNLGGIVGTVENYTAVTHQSEQLVLALAYAVFVIIIFFLISLCTYWYLFFKPRCQDPVKTNEDLGWLLGSVDSRLRGRSLYAAAIAKLDLENERKMSDMSQDETRDMGEDACHSDDEQPQVGELGGEGSQEGPSEHDTETSAVTEETDLPVGASIVKFKVNVSTRK